MNCPEHNPLIDIVRQRYREVILADNPPPAARRWRLDRFEHGLKLADEIEGRMGTLEGKRILDVGAAFGGEITAMYARGARTVGADKLDHSYAVLKERLAGDGNQAQFVLFDCMRDWPLATASFDVIISLGVLEFVQDRELFFSEMSRVLAPEGIAVISTPMALPGLRRDAHYKVPLIAMLPPPARRWIAERILRRAYRFRLSRHTYFSAGPIRRCAAKCGLYAEPAKYTDSRMMARAAQWPLATYWQASIRQVACDFVLLTPRNGQRPPEESATRIEPSRDDLERTFRLKHGDPARCGWSVRMQREFDYFNPDDHYEALVDKLVHPGTRWLDVGCGWQVFPSNPRLARTLADRCKLLVGVDPSDGIDHNTFVHRKVKQSIEDFRANVPFDVVTLRMVVEHIDDPHATVASLARLTRCGGKVVVYTVNKWSPVPVVTRLAPFSTHHLLKSVIWESTEKDTFPVAYRMNTRRRLARLFTAAGFQEGYFVHLDDCRTLGGFRRLRFLELSCRALMRRCGLRYPESCLLAVYERC